MNGELYDMIFRRKSFHLFRGVGNEKLTDAELAGIESAYQTFTPLHPEIRTAIRIVPGSETNCKRGEEYCVLIYSEKKDGYLRNVGYLGEQLDLYLVSRGIGSLWFGIGKTDEKDYEGLEYVIMIAIRKVGDETKFRKDMYKSRRRGANEIWEGEAIGGVTDIVRFAPSACNSQPWRVRNDGALSVYRYRKPGKIGIMPPSKVPFYNRIDMGIFLCFLDLCLEHEGIAFGRELFSDGGEKAELTLNAVYNLEQADDPRG